MILGPITPNNGHVGPVLVTGAAGFVGRAVVRALLAAGHEVRAGVRSAGAVVPGAETVVCDVTDPVQTARAVAGVDGIVHCAALTRVREAAARPEEYGRVNVGGTRTLLDAAASARRGDPLAVVLLSTAAVYGVPVGRPVAEDDPAVPTGPYARGKLAADVAAADLAATGAIGAVSLRPTNVAGPGDTDPTRLIPQVLAPAPALTVYRSTQHTGRGTARREYTHVDDVADAVVRALGACRPGRWRAFNAGSGVLSSVLDVVAAAERVTGRRVALDLRAPDAGVVEPPTLWCDSSRLRTELGWAAPRSDLATILRDAHTAGPGR